MIDKHSIQVYAPELNSQKDPTGGHFVANKLENYTAESLAATGRYARKDFYKITLTMGDFTYYYRGDVHHCKTGEWVLIFANRDDPYRYEIHEGKCSNGYSCMFTEDFLPLHTHIRPSDWTLFNGDAQYIFRLNEEEKQLFETIFLKMLEEQSTVHANKYDLLFIYTLECIHRALQLEPATLQRNQTAATRLAESFKTLLAGQFPLIYPHQQLTLRTPQDYATQLAVHTNYLNRVLKEVTGRTTTQAIHERMMQEAYALVVHSNWNISQISDSLGFEEPTHFTRAFKAYSGVTPSSLR